MLAAIEELEAEVKELESAIEDDTPLDEEDEDLLADLSDSADSLRSAPRETSPREAPEPVLIELGDRVHDLPEPEEKIVVDLNPKPEADLLERPEKREKKKPARPKKAGASKPSKNQLRKQARQERRRQKKQEQEEREAARRQKGERVNPDDADSEGADSDDAKGSVLGMDDLDMENPLPEAAYTPGRDHADLVMDRKKRRLEAEARADKKEKERQATWERDDEASIQEQDRKHFDLPLHVFQAVLVMLVGFLLVIGVRAAIKSMRDSEEGQELVAEESPGKKALGWLDAEKALHDYLTAPGWEAKLAYVRNPEQARPRMQRFYEKHPGEDGAMPGVEVGGQVNHLILDGGAGFTFLCRSPIGQAFRVPVVRIDHEAPFWVVDWESLVAYSDVEWAPFLEAREPGSRGIFRLWVHRENYYTLQFPEFTPRESLTPFLQEEWDKEIEKPLPDLESFRVNHSLFLTDPNREINAYGFVPKQLEDWPILNTVLMIKEERLGMSVSKSSAYNQIRRSTSNWVRSAPAWSPMVLELAFPEEVSNSFVPELEVLRFISSNWVVSQSPTMGAPDTP